MEMKVDSQRIKTERKKRAWSQQHLARVAGIGHRTVQRIETTGLASYESVMALAVVLQLDSSQLQLDDEPNSPNRPHKPVVVISELLTRLVFSMMSAIIVAFLLAIELGDSDLLDNLRLLICGGLFGATVLCPYLKRDDRVMSNAIILIAASGVSFWTASWTAFILAFDFPLVAFLVASILGVAIVVLASWFLTSLKLTRPFGPPVVLASLVGGVAMYVGFFVLSDYEYFTVATVLGFCIWHAILTLVFYFGRPADELGNPPGSVMQDLVLWVIQNSKPLREYLKRMKLRFLESDVYQLSS